MEDEGYLDRVRVLEILHDLEFDARQERTDLEQRYDQMKLNLDAADEMIIKLDGQVEMIKQVKAHLRTIPHVSKLPEDPR